MVQYKKDDIRDRIISAALEEMAVKGYKNATISAIAKRAGIATGNVYRYFTTKEQILTSAIPFSFVKGILKITNNKVNSLMGIDNIYNLEDDSNFIVFSNEMLNYIIENRLQFVILLTGSDNSVYENFTSQFLSYTQKLAIKYFKSIKLSNELSKLQRFNLYTAYSSLLRSTSEVLLNFKDEKQLREALKILIKYHQGGLQNMFK